MITTLYLLQYIAFYGWQVTSKFNRQQPVSALGIKLSQNKKAVRVASGLLFLLTIVGFIHTLGIFSGICAAVVGLMGMGCLSVVLGPFQYLGLPGVAVLYVCCVLLEIFI